MNMQNAALQHRETHKVQLRMKRGGMTHARQNAKLFRNMVVIAVVLAFAYLLLSSQAKLSELTQDVQECQVQLRIAQEEYNYMKGVLSSQTNMKTVEEVASGELGLVKLDSNQITYFTLDNGSQVELPKEGSGKLFGKLKAGVLKILAPSES